MFDFYLFESYEFESDWARETFCNACELAPITPKPGSHYITDDDADHILSLAIRYFKKLPRNGLPS